MRPPKPTIEIDHVFCGRCGGCVAVCGKGALYLSPTCLKITYSLCKECADCVRFCPVGALRFVEKQPV